MRINIIFIQVVRQKPWSQDQQKRVHGVSQQILMIIFTLRPIIYKIMFADLCMQYDISSTQYLKS